MGPKPYITEINKICNSERHKSWRFLACPWGSVLIDIGACITVIEAIMDPCHIGDSGDSLDKSWLFFISLILDTK